MLQCMTNNTLCWLATDMLTMLYRLIICALISGLTMGSVWAQDGALAWVGLSERWAKIRFDLPIEKRGEALKALVQKSQQVLTSNPQQAEPLVWHAVILSTLGRFRGGSEGLGLAKQAKLALDQAEMIQPEVLDGLIYTLKGSLYFKVPGWPIGFGDPGLAENYLKKALALNPGNIDANYFYGEFLLHKRDFKGAIKAFERVLSADPRPGQTLADAGRKREARAAIDRANGLIRQQQVEINRVLQ
jgi:tetratricopeptide (TPR) repeat protein